MLMIDSQSRSYAAQIGQAISKSWLAGNRGVVDFSSSPYRGGAGRGILSKVRAYESRKVRRRCRAVFTASPESPQTTIINRAMDTFGPRIPVLGYLVKMGLSPTATAKNRA